MMTRRRTRRLPTVLERDEIDRLLAATDSDVFRGLFLLCYHAGLRVHEAVKASWGDLRWEAGEPVKLFVRGKGNREAWLPLNRTLRDACRRRSQMRPDADADEPIFPGPWGRPYSTRQVQRMLVRSGTAAGIPRDKLHPHALRHSFATHLYQRTRDIYLVQRLLRHSNIQTTGIYTHLVIDDLQAGVDALG
jgi:site-specific recombinase XerC